jgi:regulator of sigma D|uniref:Uncharacterized protein n=2 Tax=Populus TaxID=3689 RepID=A0A3N7FI66_POPTR
MRCPNQQCQLLLSVLSTGGHFKFYEGMLCNYISLANIKWRLKLLSPSSRKYH